MELQSFIDSLELSYQVAFVPKPSTFKLDGETLKSHPMLDWKIVLGRGSHKIETDYHQGIGHLPRYPQGGLATMHDVEIAEHAFTHGAIRPFRGRILP